MSRPGRPIIPDRTTPAQPGHLALTGSRPGTGRSARVEDQPTTITIFRSPGHFAERLGLLATSENAQALGEAETLLADTVQLVKARTDADISSFCQELSQRRRAVAPPPAKHSPATP